MKVIRLDAGFAWMDTGTFDSLIGAANYIQNLSLHQNLVICSPEEIAFNNGWVSKNELLAAAERYDKSPYGKHLKDVGMKSDHD